MKQENKPAVDEHFMRSLPLLERNKKKRKAVIICAVLAVLVAFTTIFQMIKPAIAVVRGDKILDCSYEVHTHDEDCYQTIFDEDGNEIGKELICGKADYVIHHHTEECYQTVYHEDEQVEEKILVCELPETEAHQHDDSCYDEEGNLTCEKLELHTHDESCYAEDHSLICGKTVLEEHVHNEDCFTGSDEFKEEPETLQVYPAQSFEQTAGDLLISAEASEGTLPADAVMHVQEADTEEMLSVISSAVDGEITRTEAVEITFFDHEGNEIEPLQPLSISVVSSYESETETPHIVQLDEQGEASLIENEIIEKDEGEALVFETETNAVNAIVYTLKKETTITSDGHNYKISVTYGSDAGVPEESELIAWEITENSQEYQSYLEQTNQTLGIEEPDYVRLFDISIVDQNGDKVVINAPVDVKIELADAENDSLKVVHFGEEAEVLDAAAVLSEEGFELSFETAGFSVYAIVDAPEPVENAGWLKAESIDQMIEHATQGFYISHTTGYFFTDRITNINNTSRTGITRTAKMISSPDDVSGKVLYYFEKADGADNQFYIYCLSGSGKKYIKQTGNSVNFSSEEERMAFTVSTAGSPVYFNFLGNDGYYLNRQGGDNGRSFAAYNTTGDINNNMYLWYYEAPDSDPYELNGKTYGILFNNHTILGKALTSETVTDSSLAVMDVPILEMQDRSELYVSQDNDIEEWTFEYVSGFEYYITSTVNGVKKYLTITQNGATVLDTPSENSKITVTTGTGSNEGKYHFNVGADSLCMVEKTTGTDRYFSSTRSNTDYLWFNLVETKEMSVDDMMIYSAHKVSVSDEASVYDRVTRDPETGEIISEKKSKVVIYTRIWNEQTLQYEFYAIDANGQLVRVYESGDAIQWVSNSENKLLWEFTEYHYEDDVTPNYYYELQNTLNGAYIAPQVTGSQILSDNTIGINLNGRRYGYDYTTILAWDEDNYQYVGLKVDENKQLVPCVLSESDDFYFAVIREHDPGELTTVKTVDNDDYGIVMKMIDFNGEIINGDRNKVQTEFFGKRDNNVANMLSTDLDENGYPTTVASTTGHTASLSELYKASDLKDVNHLFIQSTYNESGYFEFDSTKNYAYLGDASEFTVYDQLGCISPASHARSTNHGMFLPYSPIINPATGEPWPYSSQYTNTTTTTNAALPVTDPRYGEPMHEIPHTMDNYFFGMELEASFTQTPSGLDAWGHDIIFEFSGDDDFWLYVDGELILDLGGVHSAMTGSVNFRTGIVTSTRGNTTLYELFRKHYQDRGMSASEIQQKLAEIFTQNADGQFVFKDYTNHTMKVFYMERGAGASNLHMRFNLAAVKPGTFILSKKLSGTELTDNDQIEFPYQIWYTTVTDGENTYHLLEEKTGDEFNAVYEGTHANVKFREEFTTATGNAVYQNVFFLKPGQSAEITLPENAVNYYVVECGVDTDIYETVSANDIILTGTIPEAADSDTTRRDFATEATTLEQSSKVEYDNTVKEGAMRTLEITKKLYDQLGDHQLHYDLQAEETPENDQDQTLFSFRLYLGSENADVPTLTNMYPYCVKNRDGYYCRWDTALQKFVSLGKNEYDSLTDDEKTAATFHTSINGMISKIPADYTVEVRNLIISTKYKVEERAADIPRGYTLRSGDGYCRVDEGHEHNNQDVPYTDTIKVEEDPHIEVRNQIGWGLTVKKVWTDKDFMKSHDDIWFAVYVKAHDSSEPILYENTVRRMKTNENELYYFFSDLKYNDDSYSFSDFIIYEVQLNVPEGVTPAIDNQGYVTIENGITVTPLIPTETEAARLINGGTPYNGNHQDDYEYTVTYETGEQTGRNDNIRTDTVTNSRPGIELYKTDLNSQNLAGAVFTLTDEEGNNVAAPSYTSDETGLITVAYLSKGTYILTEIHTPRGYVAYDQPWIITVSEEDVITVSGGGEDSWQMSDPPEDSVMTAIITLINHPGEFEVKKVDANTGEPLSDAVFALYNETYNSADGTWHKSFEPFRGMGQLTSAADGIIPGIDLDLPAGKYYLTEISAPANHDLLTEDIEFRIGSDGIVTIESEDHKTWLTQQTDPETGMATYVLAVKNQPLKGVSFQKVDTENTDHFLEGAVFDLYKVINDVPETTPLYSGLRSRAADGLLILENESVFKLAQGTYHLVETEAPDGYYRLNEPITVMITENNVNYTDPNNLNLSSSGEGISYDADAEVWTIKIANSSGYELPATGGAGTVGYRLIGGLLVLFTLLLKFRKH